MKCLVFFLIGVTWLSVTTEVASKESEAEPLSDYNERILNVLTNQSDRIASCKLFLYKKSGVETLPKIADVKIQQEKILKISQCLSSSSQKESPITKFNDGLKYVFNAYIAFDWAFNNYCNEIISDDIFFAKIKFCLDTFTVYDSDTKELRLRDYVQNTMNINLKRFQSIISDEIKNLKDLVKSCGVQSIEKYVEDMVDWYKTALAFMFETIELSYKVMRMPKTREKLQSINKFKKILDETRSDTVNNLRSTYEKAKKDLESSSKKSKFSTSFSSSSQEFP